MAQIDNIVKVSASIDSGGILRRNFGVTLFVTDDDTLGSSDRLKTYADLDDIKEDFASDSAPYKAADIYFQQVPFPKNFMVGRWFESAIPASLVGGALPALTSISSISDGSITINALAVPALDFSSDLSYSEIASTLQAGIILAGLNVVVTFDSITSSLTVTTVDTGVSATLTYASAGITGTDVSNLLAIDVSTAIELNQGFDAETIAEAMDAFKEIDNSWYFITLDPAYKDTQTVIDLATWVTSYIYMYFAESSDATALNTGETTSNFYELHELGSDRIAGDWTPETGTDTALTTDNLSVSSAARLSSVDFDGEDTVINPNLKDRPGIENSTITTSQESELDSKRVNRFVPVGGGTTSPTIENKYFLGYTFKDGIWQDIRYGVDWFVNAIQVSVFNLLSESNIITLTLAGQAIIKSVIEDVCNQGLINGLLAPGEVTETTKAQIISIVGNSAFNGILTQGYLVFPVPISSLSEADRIARKTYFYVWATGSGAINFVDITLVFNQ